MYFPTLNIMKNFKVDDFLIKKLDVWLGTRRKATRKHLSPLQFSVDTDIDEDTSIELFVLCTDKKIEVLQQKYNVICPSCDRILGTYTFPSEIPDIIQCPECNGGIRIKEDMVTIWFELIRYPDQEPIIENIQQFSRSVSGNDYGLSANHLKKAKSPMALRLATDFNTRFRQA